MKYALLEDESNTHDMSHMVLVGMYNTVKEAREAAVVDVELTLEGSELHEGRNDNWGGVYHICKIKESFMPVPVVKQKIKVEWEDVDVQETMPF